MSALHSLFKLKNYKESFVRLSNRDQNIIFAFLWSFPIGGIANLIRLHLEGKELTFLHFVMPCLLGVALFFVKRWPPYFYRMFRFLPFYYAALFTLLIFRLSHTWANFDYGLHSLLLLFAVLTMPSVIRWYKLSKEDKGRPCQQN
jgi:hypothetical protein